MEQPVQMLLLRLERTSALGVAAFLALGVAAFLVGFALALGVTVFLAAALGFAAAGVFAMVLYLFCLFGNWKKYSFESWKCHSTN
jgi:hypothetical protein